MPESRPYPQHYIRHGLSAHRAAVLLLNNQGEFPITDLSISIGLSLHSMELFGKAILRAFGHEHDEIRRRHRQHDLLTLLQEAQQMVLADPKTKNLALSSFLSHTPKSIAYKARFSIESGLSAMLRDKKPTNPREYFYPDRSEFGGIEPFQVLPTMAHYLGKSSQQISEALGWFDQDIES